MSYSTEKEWFASPAGQLATKFISENPGCTFTCSSHPNNFNFKIWSPSRYEHLDKWCNYIYKITTDEIKTFNDSIPENLKKLVIPIDINFHRDYVSGCDLNTQAAMSHSSHIKASSLSAFYERAIGCINNAKFVVQRKKDEEEEERIALEEYKKEEEKKRLKRIEDIRLAQEKKKEEERITCEKYKTSIIESFNSVITYTFTTDEIEALCYRYAPKYIPTTTVSKIKIKSQIPVADKTEIFKKNTLLEMQALNRFARDHYIRVEDAEIVIEDIWIDE